MDSLCNIHNTRFFRADRPCSGGLKRVSASTIKVTTSRSFRYLMSTQVKRTKWETLMQRKPSVSQSLITATG